MLKGYLMLFLLVAAVFAESTYALAPRTHMYTKNTCQDTGSTSQSKELVAKKGENITSMVWNWYRFEKSDVDQIHQSVRETETWMPLKAGESHDLDGSGDFAFLDEERTTIDDEIMGGYDDDDDYGDLSGSGDEEDEDAFETSMPGLLDNSIPDLDPPVQLQEEEDINLVKQNEVAYPPSVLLSQQNIFKKTEVLAAVIAGGAVGLFFAILLILLLVYCLKKKDEGSYDLGKKPIYKKAPTTEIYA